MTTLYPYQSDRYRRWLHYARVGSHFIDFNKEARIMRDEIFGYAGLTNPNPFKVGDTVQFVNSNSYKRTVTEVEGNFVNIHPEKHEAGWWRHGAFKKPDIYDRAASATGYSRDVVKSVAQALGFSG